MHYKDGTEVKVGDILKGPSNGHTVIGIVMHALPKADTCNLSVQPLVLVIEAEERRILDTNPPRYNHALTASDCTKVD